MMKIEKTKNGKIVLIENEGTPNEMRFGEYTEQDVYIIERHVFDDSQRDFGVKTVEFILRQGPSDILLEAKPKTSTEYFCETSDKMFDSLNKYLSFVAKRNQNAEFDRFSPPDLSSVSFRFCLVVKRLDIKFAEQALDTFSKALQKRFSQSYIRIWNLDIPNNVAVIPYALVKTANLVSIENA
jgi:hypothetical protein